MQKQTVLFLCTGNSARSQMAEALLRSMAGDKFEVFSAGLEPKGVHPNTLKVLSEVGVTTTGLRSKDVGEFLGRASIRYAIIVCSKAQEKCPSLFPFCPHILHWPFEDPALVQGEIESLTAFRKVRDQVKAKLLTWLKEMEVSNGTINVTGN